MPVGESKIPQIFSDYVFALDKSEGIARSEQFILKESGFFLHSFIEKMDNIKTIALKKSFDNKVILPESLSVQSPRVFSFFKGKNKEEIYNATLTYASAMINDFRLQSFKKNEN